MISLSLLYESMWMGDFVLITHSTFQPLLDQVKGQPYKLKNLHTQPAVEK